MQENFTQEYTAKMKKTEDIILHFIENDSPNETDFDEIKNYFNDQHFLENKHELKLILCLISQILDNHHRSPNFFKRIEVILMLFHDKMKSYFSNFEIFDIFKLSKRILLFFLQEKIITLDDKISNLLKTKKSFFSRQYVEYFYIEFKSLCKNDQEVNFFEEMMDLEIPENFEELRQIGENEDHICELIRTDSVEEFIIYTSKRGISLNSNVKSSIFETNNLLLENRPTLIQYAAFYGSINIFQYLKMNDVPLDISLWTYAIHSRNADLIHLLEECNISFPGTTFLDVFNTSIKCHHNEIAHYFHDNYCEQENNPEIYQAIIGYYNFSYLDDTDINSVFNYDKNNQNNNDSNQLASEIFAYLCQYDYIALVEFLLENANLNINYI